MVADFVLFINPWHEIMFIKSSGMTIPEISLYVVILNPLFSTWSVVYGQHRQLAYA